MTEREKQRRKKSQHGGTSLINLTTRGNGGLILPGPMRNAWNTFQDLPSSTPSQRPTGRSICPLISVHCFLRDTPEDVNSLPPLTCPHFRKLSAQSQSKPSQLSLKSEVRLTGCEARHKSLLM